MHDVIERAAEACNGLANLARRLQASTQTVSNWRARGVPVDRCADVEQATDRAVRRWELRPLDWHRIWPELIGTEGAPDAPEPTTQPGALDEVVGG